MKKFMLQSILFAGMIVFNLVNADNDHIEFIEFARNEVSIPERLGNLQLYKDNYGFHVFKDGETYDIPNYFCDPLLLRMSNEQLVNFLGRNKPKIITLTPEEVSQINPNNMVEITDAEKDNLLSLLFGSGYIAINQMDDGEYILRAKIRLLGGGFFGSMAKIFTVGLAVDLVGCMILSPVGYYFVLAPIECIAVTIYQIATEDDPKSTAAKQPEPNPAPNPAPQPTDQYEFVYEPEPIPYITSVLGE